MHMKDGVGRILVTQASPQFGFIYFLYSCSNSSPGRRPLFRYSFYRASMRGYPSSLASSDNFDIEIDKSRCRVACAAWRGHEVYPKLLVTSNLKVTSRRFPTCHSASTSTRCRTSW
ncbi:hypothetical protein BDN67DRAFT_975610 [Paxillus ammoniavirescens]|nr:hypothetical protein BDN67DRAFT_975610 [Paxillus ammoniavirescens]